LLELLKMSQCTPSITIIKNKIKFWCLIVV
jgi:hypothetical protein